MMPTFVIEGELADLNTYIQIERSNRFGAAAMKKASTSLVAQLAKYKGLKPLPDVPYKFFFEWFCKDQKKDPDNIAFAKKFILDGLKEAGIIKNDGWKNVRGFGDMFYVDKENPRIVISFYKPVGSWNDEH